MKNTITEIKYIMNGINCKVDTVKERTDELKDKNLKNHSKFTLEGEKRDGIHESRNKRTHVQNEKSQQTVNRNFKALRTRKA